MEVKIDFKATNKELPKDGQEVYVIYDNEILKAVFRKGITEKEREKMRKGEMKNEEEIMYSSCGLPHKLKRSEIYKAMDEGFNNVAPYAWDIARYGITLRGKDITLWCER